MSESVINPWLSKNTTPPAPAEQPPVNPLLSTAPPLPTNTEDTKDKAPTPPPAPTLTPVKEEAETKPEVKEETQAEAKDEAKEEAKEETRAEAKDEAKAEDKDETKEKAKKAKKTTRKRRTTARKTENTSTTDNLAEQLATLTSALNDASTGIAKDTAQLRDLTPADASARIDELVATYEELSETAAQARTAIENYTDLLDERSATLKQLKSGYDAVLSALTNL